MTGEPDETVIKVAIGIDRRLLASFKARDLSRYTGIPVETLLTSFDTWSDDDAEQFLESLTDDGFGYPYRVITDDSMIEEYEILEENT